MNDEGVAGFEAEIEFNPVMASAYRLVGYESDEGTLSFSDGPSDARLTSSIGPGRSVTVLYEVVPAGIVVPSELVPRPPLKYQKLTPMAQHSGELATLSVRYRITANAPTRIREFAVSDEGRAFGEASEDFRAAAFGLVLRNSAYKGTATYQFVIETLPRTRESEGPSGRAGLLELAKRAKAIAGAQ